MLTQMCSHICVIHGGRSHYLLVQLPATLLRLRIGALHGFFVAIAPRQRVPSRWQPVFVLSLHLRHRLGNGASGCCVRLSKIPRQHQHLACPSSRSHRQAHARFSPSAARRSTPQPRATTFPFPAAAARQPIAPFRPASASFVRLAWVARRLGQWSITTWEVRYRKTGEGRPSPQAHSSSPSEPARAAPAGPRALSSSLPGRQRPAARCTSAHRAVPPAARQPRKMRPRHHSSSQPQLQIGRAAFFIAPGTLNLWNLCSRELKEHKKKDSFYRS